jgi:uncharacterized damage-inducible protein DinB
MTVVDVLRSFDYGYWANRRLLPTVSELTPEEFTRPVAGCPRSIRDILVHAMSAEWGWVERCGGPPRGAALKPEDYPTAEPLAATWGIVEGHVRGFVSRLSEQDLAREVEFTIPRGEKRSLALGQLLQHAANHTVHHRAQVSLLLSLLGRTPDGIDMLLYDAEKRGAPLS